MSKRRRHRQAPVRTATTETAPAVVQAREVSSHHHGNHRGLLQQVAGVKSRDSGSATAFGKVEFYDKARKGGYLHLYVAASSMVAVAFRPEGDLKCWNYASYSITDERAALSILDGRHPEHAETSTKRNTLHVRLDDRVDMGLVADLGAAAAFVATQVDIGEPNLPPMSYVGSARAQSGEHQIRARLFVPGQNKGSSIAIATTHLREDTTSMLAFEGSNTDTIAASLSQGNMIPGDSCHSLPEFIDLSMFRAEQSAEAHIGQLMARSMCQFTTE